MSLTSDVEAGLRLIVSLQLFWEVRAFPSEVGDWLAQLLKLYDRGDARRARALVAYSTVLVNHGDLTQALAVAEQGLQLSRAISDHQAEAFSLWGMGTATSIQGDLRRGIP